MKHTINNPLVLKTIDHGDFSGYIEKKYVSKEVAEEYLDILKHAESHLKRVRELNIFSDGTKIKNNIDKTLTTIERIKNAESC